MVHDRMETWMNMMINGQLRSNLAWLGYKLQLWEGRHYGIGIMTNGLERAKDVLANLDYEMLPILWIAQTVKKVWQQIHTTFGGF